MNPTHGTFYQNTSKDSKDHTKEHFGQENHGQSSLERIRRSCKDNSKMDLKL
jgi:hypothetical protein